MQLRVTDADFSDPRLAEFLRQHLDELAPTAPPESRHALDLAGLRRPGVQLWTAHSGSAIVGTAALATLDPRHEELKSMRTAAALRGQGIATLLLAHALDDARRRGVERISLETGSMPFFAPARALYVKHGFDYCSPFASYVDDPNSVFMTRTI